MRTRSLFLPLVIPKIRSTTTQKTELRAGRASGIPAVTNDAHLISQKGRGAQFFAAIAVFIGTHVSPLAAETLNPAAFRVIANNCAPGVSPEILEKLVAAESGFEMFAIGVNGLKRRSYTPETAAEASMLARYLIAQGHSVDMGLAQINSANLGWLKLTPKTVFEPCANLTAAEKVLRDGYERARLGGISKAEALGKALSVYNTGSFTRGFANGYVSRVLNGDPLTDPENNQPLGQEQQAAVLSHWDVFGGSPPSNSYVFE